MRMTDEQLEAHLNKHQNRKNEGQQPSKQQYEERVLGRLKQGVMNKTEAKYAGHLESLKMCGEIQYYAFDYM